MNVYSYEELRDHVAECRKMAEVWERWARSFYSWLFREREKDMERATYWRERADMWDARIKEYFDTGVAARAAGFTEA